jgi:hypothetical protein
MPYTTCLVVRTKRWVSLGSEEGTMQPRRSHAHTILRDLGDGLRLRRSTPDDAEALAAFNARVHSNAGPEHPNVGIAAWTRDLLTGEHPSFGVADCTIVEEVHTGAIVSSVALISQTWTYDGIPFGVGRPELVGTSPAYRRRGLVRAQFEVIHQWSAERGERVQAITGIPWYYRQFGYEMAINLEGGRVGYRQHIPLLQYGEPEPYRVRPATAADLPCIAQLVEHANLRYRVTCVRDAELWHYEAFGKRTQNTTRAALCMIDAAAESVGFLAHPARLLGSTQVAWVYELKPGVSWVAVTPSVIRYLATIGTAHAARDQGECSAFGFWVGRTHPVYDAMPNRLPHARRLYAWYLRVPDLSGFLQHIAPALERRLATSVVAGYTGEVHLSFYRSGLRLAFHQGSLRAAAAWQPTPEERGTAAFPDLTFLQLVFGYRTLDELRYAFADCWVENDETQAVLEALFPRQDSDVWPIA